MDFEFDYGAEIAEGSGVKRVNPEEGLQYGYLKSVIHLGKIGSTYKGKVKDPSNRVCLNFELMGNLADAESDDYISGLHPETGEPLNHSLTINLVKGDNAMLTKVMAALVSKKEMETNAVKGWDQLIGRPVTLNLKGSEKKGEDGKPAYVDVKEISQFPSALKPLIKGIKTQGVGHCLLKNLTLEAMDEVNMYIDVQVGMMKSEEWKAGTHPAIALVDEIRKTNPNYAKATKAADDGAQAATEGEPKGEPAESVTANEEF